MIILGQQMQGQINPKQAGLRLALAGKMKPAAAVPLRG